MSYEDIIGTAFDGHAKPRVHAKVKMLDDGDQLRFPVLLCMARKDRPFREYKHYTREDCPLCSSIRDGKTTTDVVAGMEWLPADYPIKSLHGICYPREHRATILERDISVLGNFVDRAADAVACINLRGSAASIPEHFHFQLHDISVPGYTGHDCEHPPAFPLLSCPTEVLLNHGGLRIARVLTYPAFVLLVHGDWDMLGQWVVTYMAASNMRLHNFALAPGQRLFVIPRGLEKAHNQENRYGASEMLGLISPVTPPAYNAIRSVHIVLQALSDCGLADPQERLAVEEHASWVTRYVPPGRGSAR